MIGVHCTHGVNRTGYLICRYLIQRMNWDPQAAIDGKRKIVNATLELSAENWSPDIGMSNLRGLLAQRAPRTYKKYGLSLGWNWCRQCLLFFESLSLFRFSRSPYWASTLHRGSFEQSQILARNRTRDRFFAERWTEVRQRLRSRFW